MFKFLWKLAQGLGLLIVLLLLLSFCKSQPQPPEKTYPIVKKQAEEVVKPSTVVKKEPAPSVTRVKYHDKVWLVTVNKEAVKLVKQNGGQVHLQIGYCSWNDGEWYNKDSVKFEPAWTPSLDDSRITTGIWKNKYLSSVVVKTAGKKMDPNLEIAYGNLKKELQSKVAKIEIDLEDAKKLVKELDKLKEMQEENDALKNEIKKVLK